MPERRCPLCGQPLPEALTQIQLNSRLQELASPAVAEERKRLHQDLENRLSAERKLVRQRTERELQGQMTVLKKRAEKIQQESEDLLRRERAEFDRRLRSEKVVARRAAESELKGQVAGALKRAAQAEAEAKKKIEINQKTIELRLRKEMAQTLRANTRESALKLEKLQAERERDRLRHEGETARLQGQLDALSRKLDKMSGEQLGDEGELDLIAALEGAFPKDRLERIGRGQRGADVVQHVIEGASTVGRIVYENKNVSVWTNTFVKQAEKYRTQYETPYVMIVSRAFPKKQKDFCVVGEIPVVSPRMAVALASVMREGVIAIGRLRLTGAGRDQKAHELLQYVIGDKFSTRFKTIVDCVDDLRQHQTKERNWHENAWETQSSMHERIAKCHREISAQLDTVLMKRRPVAVAARA